MGVIHKLRPEVRAFIVENKRTNPQISCRNLTSLVQEKLQVKISKSSINAIFKQAGLSLSVGRRLKAKKRKFILPPVLPVLAEEPPKAQQVEAAQLEQEKMRLEQEKARLEQEQRKAQEQEELRIKQQQRLAEEEAQRKAEEEKTKQEAELRAEQERIRKEEEAARNTQEQEQLRIKQQQRLAEEEAQRKAEEEKARQGAELKAEQERSFRLAEERPKIKQETSGVVLLRAVDFLVGGTPHLSRIVQKNLDCPAAEAEALTEFLIYQEIFNNDLNSLNSFIGRELPEGKISDYLRRLQESRSVKQELSRVMPAVFSEARGIKMHFKDGSIIYFDGQMHTTWSTPYTPYDFSATAGYIKEHIKRYLLEEGALVLFMVPGYDIPTKEFFTLLSNFNSANKNADKLTLYGNKLEDLANIPLSPADKRSLLFGLWPWQFTAYRKVKKIGEFSKTRISCLNKDFYLAEIEIELMPSAGGQLSALKGCAIKAKPEEKIRLVVLSNLEKISLQELAEKYLGHWPNLEEGFKDFSRKIELFTYTGESQTSFSYENLAAQIKESDDLKAIFSGYAEALDAYLRWHFMPSGYEQRQFGLSKERFYSQKAQLNPEQGSVTYTLEPQAGYAYPKDLDYICRRLNESDIRAFSGEKVRFENVFK